MVGAEKWGGEGRKDNFAIQASFSIPKTFRDNGGSETECDSRFYVHGSNTKLKSSFSI